MKPDTSDYLDNSNIQKISYIITSQSINWLLLECWNLTMKLGNIWCHWSLGPAELWLDDQSCMTANYIGHIACQPISSCGSFFLCNLFIRSLVLMTFSVPRCKRRITVYSVIVLPPIIIKTVRYVAVKNIDFSEKIL